VAFRFLAHCEKLHYNKTTQRFNSLTFNVLLTSFKHLIFNGLSMLNSAVRVLSKDKQGFGVWCGARCGC